MNKTHCCQSRRVARSWIQILTIGSCLIALSACGEAPSAGAGSDEEAGFGSGSGSGQAGENGAKPEALPDPPTGESNHTPHEAARLVPEQAPEVFEDFFRTAADPRCLYPDIASEISAIRAGAALNLTSATRATPMSTSLNLESVRIAVPFSGTNLQVADVDEADRVKFDGEYLFITDRETPYFSRSWMPFGRTRQPPVVTSPFVATSGTITTAPVVLTRPSASTSIVVTRPSASTSIVVANRPEIVPIRYPDPIHTVRVMRVDPDTPGATEVARIEPPNGNSIQGMYHLSAGSPAQSKLLAVLGNQYPQNYRPYSSFPMSRRSLAAFPIVSGSTLLDIYDVDDPSTPSPTANIELDGALLASRRLGDRLILVTQYHPARQSPCGPRPLEWQTQDETAPSADDSTPLQLFPTIRVNAGEPEPLVGIDNCFLPLDASNAPYGARSITTVTSINLRDPSDRTSMCLGGVSGRIYASTEALYLSQFESIQQVATTTLPPSTYYQNGVRIFKVSFDAAGPTYRGSGFVRGILPNNFSMGEHEGVLGVITLLKNTVHRLTLLRESPGDLLEPTQEPMLEIVSVLPNDENPAPIGKPGEQLHAIRFMGSRIYAVTFKKIDPLYIIDVEDPEHPFIAGELEIPGFSDYLQPIGENLLLGIGKDAFDMGDFAWYQGIKVELFDVRDPATLSSIDSVLIGKRSSQSSALSDPHAVAHLPMGEGRHRFTIPIRVHDGPDAEPSAWHPWVETGLFLFEVEESSNPLQSTLENVGKIIRDSNSDSEPNYAYPRSTTHGERAVLSGDQVHYIHGEDVWSASWFAPQDAVGPQ